MLNQYKHCLKQSAFVYQGDLLEKVDQISDAILDILNLLIANNQKIAESKIKELIEGFITDPFLVSDLDSSYSFRGLAPFIDFQSEGYSEIYQKMKREELTFFRVRTPKKEDDNCNITKIEDILHLPFSKRNIARAERFSVDEVPCLYLGTTTYVCSKECNWNEDKYLYASIFVPNEYGKKLKIFNLTISQYLINGINPPNKKSIRRQQLQNSFIKIFPLVIATSFRVPRYEKEEQCIKERKEVKYEYLISQALMRVLKELRIDGIAYLSMKGKNGLQYPIGVNIAFPAFDISEDKEYSQICKGFEVSKPIKFSGQREIASKKLY